MPTCRPSQFKATVSCRSTRSIKNGVLKSYARRSGSRHASTVASLAKLDPPKQPPKRSSIRTILHKTESFLPRVLSTHKKASTFTNLGFWQAVLNGAYDRVNSKEADRAARVVGMLHARMSTIGKVNNSLISRVVYSYDEFSGARELVTALLEEPFTPEVQKQSIRDRWKSAGDSVPHLTIKQRVAPSGDSSEVQIPANWLHQFSVPVELKEIRSPSGSRNAQQNLFAADVPIIVCNPIITPLSEVVANRTLPLSHGNAILAVITSPSVPCGSLEQLVKHLPETLSIVFVDPIRALGALATLSSNTNSALAVQRYQDDYTGSRISDLTAVLASKLSDASQGDLTILSEATAREQVKASLEACGGALVAAEREVGTVVTGVLGLRDKIAELETRFGAEVLGTEGSATVEAAIGRAKKEVKTVLDELTWWRCIWRVDELGDLVRTSVRRAWCRDLEDEVCVRSWKYCLDGYMSNLFIRSLYSMVAVWRFRRA